MWLRVGILTFIIVVTMTGCSTTNKSFYYNFIEEKAFANSEGKWYVENKPVEEAEASIYAAGFHSFEDEGLLLDELGITYENMFLGNEDIEYEVVFYLNVDQEHKVNFAIGLSDGTLFETANNYLMLWWFEDGRIESGFYWIDSQDYSHRTWLGDLDHILINGRNYFKLTKVGNNVEVIVNSLILQNTSFEFYSSRWFTPTIVAYSDVPLGEYGFFVESVKVDYPQAVITPTPEPQPEEPV